MDRSKISNKEINTIIRRHFFLYFTFLFLLVNYHEVYLDLSYWFITFAYFLSSDKTLRQFITSTIFFGLMMFILTYYPMIYTYFGLVSNILWLGFSSYLNFKHIFIEEEIEKI